MPLSTLIQASYMQDIPTEILRLIFVHANLDFRHKPHTSDGHEACLQNECLGPRPPACECTPGDKVFSSEWQREHITSSSLFPHTISSVCQRWRDIMESIPAFWTRVVAFIDNHPTALSRLERQLQLSKDFYLDVLVLRHPSTYNVVDADEHARCRTVIDLVMPHLHRCRSISFHTLYTSSLPSISHDFRGPALALTNLMLCGCVDDGRPSGDWMSRSILPPKDIRPLSCPNLSKIDVDGRNFVYACLDSPSWRASLKDSSREDDSISLSLSKFTPASAKDRQFSLDDVVGFLAELPLLELTLRDIEFHIDFNTLPPPTATELRGNAINFIGLKAQFMAEFFACVEFEDMEFLHIERCELGEDILPRNDRYNLTLQDIGAGEDIAGFLSSWAGFGLDVVRCPGFDDLALSALVSPEWEDCVTLSFHDCEGFTVPGLVRMLQAMSTMNTDGDRRSVTFLTVEGRGPRGPSEEERKEIEKSVCWLSWHATGQTPGCP